MNVWAARMALLPVAALVACATPEDVRPGASRQEVISRWGEPKAVYALSSGERLLYSPQPYTVQGLDFDAQGKLVRSEQMLTAQHLGALVAGQSRMADVLHAFGPPLRRAAGADDGSAWTYSFRDHGAYRLAYVHMDAAGVVRSVDFADDPAADDRYRQ